MASSLSKPLNKFKDGSLKFASSCVLRVSIAAEQAKQEKRYQKLGERVLQALIDGKLETLKTDPATVELVGTIQEKKLAIQDMQNQIRTAKYSGEEN